MTSLRPKDIIALFSIAVVFIYKATGHNGGFDAMVTLIIGYYFGRRDDATMNVLAQREKN